MNPYRVIFGAGAQSLLFTPDGARLTSAQYFIEDAEWYQSGSSARYLASGTVSVDSFSGSLTFIAGAAEPDPRKIYLSTVSGLQAGHTYELYHSSTHDVESIDLKSIGTDPVSGSYAYSLHPLYGRSFPTGSVLRGKELSITFPASIANDPQYIQNPRTLFLIISGSDANGFPYRVPRQIRITRNSLSDYSYDSIAKRLIAYFPTRHKSDGFDIKSRIDEAARLVESDIRKTGKNPEELLLGSTGEDLIVWKTSWLLAISPTAKDSADYESFAEKADKQYQELMDHLRVGKPQPDVKQIENTSEQIKPKPYRSPWRRFGV